MSLGLWITASILLAAVIVLIILVIFNTTNNGRDSYYFQKENKRRIFDTKIVLSDNFTLKNLTVAIYSANFGRYRKETKQGIDIINFIPGVDYYFYTDDFNITSSNWNVILTEKQEELSYMDANRHSAKFTKWNPSNQLLEYDLIIWLDTKSLYMNNQLSIGYFNSVSNEPGVIFLLKHLKRTHPRQEILSTIAHGFENIKSALTFFKKIEDEEYDITLPDTTILVYKPEAKPILNNVYNDLIENKLKRDQNIIQYSLKKSNAENQVSYL